MTISGGRTKQLYIFCHVTGFTSDFLSFIVVELIWFFHGALQFCSFYEISRKSDNKSSRFSRKTIFIMAAVRHVEFAKNVALSCDRPWKRNLRLHTKLH